MESFHSASAVAKQTRGTVHNHSDASELRVTRSAGFAENPRQVRELIEHQGAGANVEVTRQEVQRYIVKFNW